MRTSIRQVTHAISAGLVCAGLLTAPAQAASKDEPVGSRAMQPELPILLNRDFRNTPAKEFLAKAGSSIPLQPASAPSGWLRIAWSIMPWAPPPAPEGKPQPPQTDPGSGLFIRLSNVEPSITPIDIAILGPTSWRPGVSITQGSYEKQNFVTRHQTILPADKLGGEWRVRWNHGLITIEAQGESILEVYLPGETPASGLASLEMKVGAHDIAFSQIELRGARPPGLIGPAKEAFETARSLVWGIRGLSQAGNSTAAFERAQDRVRLLDEAKLGHRSPLDVAAAHLDLADAAILIGRFKEVGPHDEQALRLLRSACGEDHPASLEALVAIEHQVDAILVRSTPSTPSSRAALTDLADRLTSTLGPGSWLVIELRWAIYRWDRPSWLGQAKSTRLADYRAEIASARSLYRSGRFRDLGGVAERAVASARFVGGGAEPELADALTLYGLAVAGNGDVERSLAPLREALALRERHFGASHPSTLTARNNVGYALFLTGRYRSAAHEAREVYLARSRSLGRHAPQTWQALRNLMLAEVEAFGRTALPAEFRRSSDELGGLIERGAGDPDPYSADYLWIKQYRSVLPILKMYAQYPAPEARFWKWPERVPFSLLDDPVAFELGRARGIQREIGSFGSLRMPNGEIEYNLNRLSHRILVSLLGEESGWTTLAWYSSPVEPEKAIERFRRDFGADHPFTAIVVNNFAVSIQANSARRDEPFPPTHPESRAGLERAEGFTRAALETLRRRLGEEHPQVASVRELLGVTLYHQGRTSEARA